MLLTHGGDIYSYKKNYGNWPLDFSANVNPAGVPKSVQAAIAEAAAQVDWYPDPLCRELCAALSQHESLAERSILCGNGAADLIWRFVRALRPKNALVVGPTFAEYEMALKSEGTRIKYYLLAEDKAFKFNAELLDQLTDETEVLFLCNPNNPTGNSVDTSVLQSILKRCHELKITLFLDACFSGFLEQAERPNLASELTKYPRLFVLKAFTKLYGMPGVRLGYCLSSNTALLERMHQAGPPWAVSSLAQAAGLAALQDKQYLAASLDMLAEERDFLHTTLQKLGLLVFPSETNFILFYTADSALATKLLAHGVLIRDCSNFHGLRAGYYRIAVRQHGDNQQLINALKKSLKI